jgi:hypothetical protein
MTFADSMLLLYSPYVLSVEGISMISHPLSMVPLSQLHLHQH